MKKTCLALAAGLMLSFPAFAEITVTDVKGREVTVPDVPKRVVLGFYYEDYLAVAGPGAADRLVGLSLTTWTRCRSGSRGCSGKRSARVPTGLTWLCNHTWTRSCSSFTPC